LPTIPEMDYGLPGAPPRIAPPEDAIYRTQSGAEYPAGWSSKAPEVAPQDAYGRGQFTAQARAQFPEQTRIAEDALKDWRETYYEPMNNAASTEGALNWAAPVNKRTGVPGEGYGKTLLPILDADYETRLRLNLEAQGVDTSRMTWRTKPEYTAPIADENLVARGYDPNVTRKDMTMEARMDQYIRTADPTGVMVTTKSGTSRSLEQWLLDNQVIRKTEGTTDADRAAFFRYQYAQQQRQRLQLLREPGRLDQFFADANIPAPRAVPNAQDIAKLPTTETQTTWGNAWGASVTDVLKAAPSDVQAEVSRVLADKVDELHLDRYDLMTPRQQALSDIDYSVAMSQELAKRGVAVPRPPAVWNNPGDNLGTTIRSLVFAPENDAFHANIDRLIEQGVLSETAPASSMYMLDRPGYLKQKQAYQLYSDIFRYRDAVNGEALRVVTPPSPPALRAEKVMVGKKVTWQAVNDADGTVMETFPRRKDALQYIDEQTARANDITQLNARTTTKPPAPVLGPYTTTLSQEKFDEVVGRTMASPSIGDLRGHGDGLIADALATGMIDEDTARVASRIVHLPAVGKTPARDITVMDLVLEKMYAFDDMNTVKRAVGSDVAEANKIARSVKDAVTNDILRAEGVTQAEAKGILRWLDEGTGFVKENLLMSPARAASAGMQDATGNALFQLITGHANAAAKTLVNPTAWWSLMKHNMRAVEFEHPTMELLKEAGVQLPHGVIDIQTREMFEVGSKTRLERLIGKTGVPEGAAGRISGIVASKWARAWRHAIDQNARLNLFGDVFRTGLRKAQGDFLLHVRSVVDNPDEANRIVRELGWAEKKAFSPEDVRRVTGRNDFAREYRTRIEALSKEAHDEVLRVHFTYRNTKADEVTRRILLFHYWQSRAVLFYPKTVLGNPYLLNLHYKMWKSLADEAQRQDAGNPLNLMFDVMAGDGGIYAQFDPIHAIVPYVVSQTFGINYAGETGFDRWQRKFGVYVNPFIQAAMIVAGQSTSRVDLTGTSALRTLITKTIDYARNHGYVIDNPGITKDYVQDVENRVLEIINSGVRAAFPGVPDYNVPDLNKTAQTQVNAIIVANAERDFDTQFADMTTEQKEEVLAAEIAVRSGQDDNDRANEAMAQYSTVGFAGAWWKALPTPFGNTQIRSEDVDQHRADVDAAYASLNAGQPLTPAEQSALDADSLIRTGSQAAGTLDIENDAYRGATSDFENTIAEGYNLIAFGQVDPGAYEDIGGKRYYGWQINEMGKDQRDKLATAWVLQNGGAGALKSYKDKRAKVVDSSTELKGYKDYTKRASNYNGGEQYKENDINRVMDYTGGGMRDFRNYLENGTGNGPSNPNFARAIQAQRAKLQAQGYSGEDLETRLDSWAYTTDAYNAYRGTKGSISDPNPITTNATDNQLTAAGPGETAPAESGGTGSGGTKKPKADTSTRPATYQGYSGDWDATGNRPQWQSDLAAEVDTYQQAIAKFEAEYGSVQNFTMHPEVVARYLPKPSNDMQAYLNWADQEQRSGGDGSFKAYLAYKDAQYAERYPAKKKDTTKDTTEPTPVFIPAWQQASP
jgi:hypothetical protein